MNTSQRITHALLAICAMAVMGTAALAADPGLTYPINSAVSDQKAGSVLVYTVYTSAPAAANTQNARINITNTSSTSAAFVHLFFVEGATCSVSDRNVCLTANQTLTFLASEQDPGVTGFIVAIAVSGVTGCPVSFNHLIGDLFVKFQTGHQANLGAEAFSALYEGQLPGCNDNSFSANIAFNGVAYNLAPRVLAASSIPSPADGNDTRLIVLSLRGDLFTTVSSFGALFGILYNDQEEPHSWTTTGACHFVRRFENSFPRTSPRFDQVIPAGQTGWTKFWAVADNPILGAVINFNPNAGSASGAFNGGRNLHKLTLSSNGAFTMPIFPPAC